MEKTGDRDTKGGSLQNNYQDKYINLVPLSKRFIAF